MDQELRTYFDRHLEYVLQELPTQVHQLLEEVPLVVDDYPNSRQCRELGLRRRHEICGLYTGIPLTERPVDLSGVPGDVIQIFREGILHMSRDRSGRLSERELRRQIRVTILHEVGHHFGLSEEDLDELGYG
jgi:predicted Zn-dependent protease with MMP-like domain